MCDLENQLRILLKQSMLARKNDPSLKNKTENLTFKNILQNAQKAAKDKQIVEIDDSMVIDAAKKEIKQLNDLLQFCENKPEKVEEIDIAINAAELFLPKMATEAEIEAFVNAHKNEASNVGAMMKLLKANFGASLDGRIASTIVKNNI